jgi:hypothetical protein
MRSLAIAFDPSNLTVSQPPLQALHKTQRSFEEQLVPTSLAPQAPSPRGRDHTPFPDQGLPGRRCCGLQAACGCSSEKERGGASERRGARGNAARRRERVGGPLLSI